MTLEDIAVIGNAPTIPDPPLWTLGEQHTFALGKKMAVDAIVAAMLADHAEIIRQIEAAYPERREEA